MAAVLAISAVMGWWRTNRPAPLAPHPLVQLSANLPPGAGLYFNGNQVVLSPDGTRIVVSMHDAPGGYRLAMRRLDQSQFVPLSGTEGAMSPFFSPDGQWIGFWTNTDHKLKKIAIQSGALVTLCDAPGGFWGASWGEDDNIIAALNSGLTGLVRVPSGGGAPTRATEVIKAKGERAHVWPQVLPGSHAILLTAITGGTYNDASIDVVLLKTGERKTVHRGGFFGRYLATSDGVGHLVYMHQNTLFAEPFDLSRLVVTGAPHPVLEDVSLSGAFGNANLDFSAAPSGSGTFVYLSRTGESAQSIFWLDSAGKTQPLYSAPGTYSTPHFSPDGKRLAFRIVEPGPGPPGYIWIQDLDRGVVSRLTHISGIDPAWTPDGTSLVFSSRLAPPSGLYWIRADGSSEEKPLTDNGVRRVAGSFTPDGKLLAYSQIGASGHAEIWTVPVEGDPDHPRLGKAEPFLQVPFDTGSAKFSPDGRWLAYVSNETGINEVYVRPFPGPGSRLQISAGGGTHPIWSPSAQRELFFLNPDRRIMVAAYTARGNSFATDKPRVWSEKRLLDQPYLTFDLAPDGKRFAVVLYGDGSSEPVTQLTVLLNFFDELKRRVPVNK